jgi:hypothetical protein
VRETGAARGVDRDHARRTDLVDGHEPRLAQQAAVVGAGALADAETVGQVTGSDDGGMWTLQASVFPENRASLALHRSAGYRTLGVRSRIARLDGQWRDTVLLERRGARC